MLLPPPLGPTSATTSPGLISRSMSRSTGSPGVYANVTCSTRIAVENSRTGCACARSAISTGASSSSKARSAAASPGCTVDGYWAMNLTGDMSLPASISAVMNPAAASDRSSSTR